MKFLRFPEINSFTRRQASLRREIMEILSDHGTFLYGIGFGKERRKVKALLTS